MKKQFIIGSVATVFLAILTTFIILYLKGVFDSFATKRDKAKERFNKALTKLEGSTDNDLKNIVIELKKNPIRYSAIGRFDVKFGESLCGLQDAFEALYEYEKYKVLADKATFDSQNKNPKQKDIKKFFEDHENLSGEASYNFFTAMKHKLAFKYGKTDDEKETIKAFFGFEESDKDLDKAINGLKDLMKNDKTASSELRNHLKLIKSHSEEILGDYENYDLYYILEQSKNSNNYAFYTKVIYLCSLVLDS